MRIALREVPRCAAEISAPTRVGTNRSNIKDTTTSRMRNQTKVAVSRQTESQRSIVGSAVVQYADSEGKTMNSNGIEYVR